MQLDVARDRAPIAGDNVLLDEDGEIYQGGTKVDDFGRVFECIQGCSVNSNSLSALRGCDVFNLDGFKSPLN